MFTDTYVNTPAGLVDLIAVERFVAGKPVDLEPAERPVAVWAALAAGLTRNQIAERLRCRTDYVKAVLDGPPPRDRRRRQILDTSRLVAA